MEQVSVHINEAETKTTTVFHTEDGHYLVQYVEPGAGEHGYVLQTGHYSTVEVATAKAEELLTLESISGETLAGDVE